MAVLEPHYSKEEFARRGQAISEQSRPGSTVCSCQHAGHRSAAPCPPLPPARLLAEGAEAFRIGETRQWIRHD